MYGLHDDAIFGLFDDAQLGIIQHDLLLAVVLKFNGSDRIMCGAFETGYFTEAEFLVLDFVSDLQLRSIARDKIRAWIMFDGLHVWLGGNVCRLCIFFGRWRSVFFFCLGGRISKSAAMHAIIGGAGRSRPVLDM